MMRVFAASLAVVLAASSAEAAAPTLLFSADSTIDIRITGPIRDIANAASRSTDAHPATLELLGSSETHAIELSARGLSRRTKEVCKFPPLRVKFVDKPGEASLFHKQGTLKLVTHCRTSESFQQYTLLEYAAYRLYNVVTPESFRVRLANVEYVDSKKGKVVAKRIGFFIEDVDDLARRVDKKEVERPSVNTAHHDPDAAAKAALFHYMIGNLDWDANFGPDGENCCHNGKLIGANENATTGIVLIPYDFDHSGLVDAPYATPPESIDVRSVRSRVYRGYCRHNDAAKSAAARYSALKGELVAALGATPGLTSKTKSKATAYLGEFFKTIEDPGAFEGKVLRKCRG
jgi:hypothetical protein